MNIKNLIEVSVDPNSQYLILLKSEFSKNLTFSTKSKFYSKGKIAGEGCGEESEQVKHIKQNGKISNRQYQSKNIEINMYSLQEPPNKVTFLYQNLTSDKQLEENLKF